MLYPAELPGPGSDLDARILEGGRFAGKGREVKIFSDAQVHEHLGVARSAGWPSGTPNSLRCAI